MSYYPDNERDPPNNPVMNLTAPVTQEDRQAMTHCDLNLHDHIGDQIEAAGEHFVDGRLAIAARLLREAADKIDPEHARHRIASQAELVEARLSFVSAVEDGLTWNSSQSQCLWRIQKLVTDERAALAKVIPTSEGEPDARPASPAD